MLYSSHILFHLLVIAVDISERLRLASSFNFLKSRKKRIFGQFVHQMTIRRRPSRTLRPILLLGPWLLLHQIMSGVAIDMPDNSIINGSGHKYSVILPTYNERQNLPVIVWLLARTFNQ